jgi:hypothetical protein
MTMKKITITTILLLALMTSGCSLDGGSAGGTPEDATLQTYQTDEYQITIPKAWSIIRKNEFTSDIPQNASVVFLANRKNEVFLTNVNITKNPLGKTVSSLDYGNIIVQNQKSALQNFAELGREEFSTSIGGKKDRVMLVKFQGKRTGTDPLLTILQSYYVNNTTAYIITAASVSNEDPIVQKEAENIVRSFAIK